MHTNSEVTKNKAGAMPGMIFTGCSVMDAQRTQAAARALGKGKAKPAAGRRREVKVGGKRVKTIDVHAHCVIPEAMALLGVTRDSQRGPGIDQVGRAASARWTSRASTWRRLASIPSGTGPSATS